eukprot:Gb_11837 [translate_table: standard]
MHRQANGSPSLALRVRAEERINAQTSQQYDEDEPKKPHSLCKAERAIHLIPLLLLGCLLLLYAFSYPPIQDSIQNTKEINVRNLGTSDVGMQGSKSAMRTDSMGSSSVYTHRSLNQIQEERRRKHVNKAWLKKNSSGLNAHRKLRIHVVH